MHDQKESDLLDYEDADFSSIIASDISFTGKIRFSKPFLIKGCVNGDVVAQSDLVVDVGANVNADVQAERVLVRGVVKGNINGRALVFITSTGSVTGDISAARVVLEGGGRFCGRCTMVDKKNEN